jgi:hypothetical protein
VPYTHILIAKPDIDLYETFKDIEGLKGLQVLTEQEVVTSEAFIQVFKTATPLSAITAGDMLHAPGVWYICVNLDGKPRQPHLSL